ncbi:hypothetical protein [Facilibium subflavum]|uniref:hypothetical protein n=1 Tax=Facilibium subflavum TaxID=2219058 RepID=UPI0013C339AB|nr:hypothetical protein [Facilibium subflavum]
MALIEDPKYLQSDKNYSFVVTVNGNVGFADQDVPHTTIASTLENNSSNVSVISAGKLIKNKEDKYNIEIKSNNYQLGFASFDPILEVLAQGNKSSIFFFTDREGCKQVNAIEVLKRKESKEQLGFYINTRSQEGNGFCFSRFSKKLKLSAAKKILKGLCNGAFDVLEEIENKALQQGRLGQVFNKICDQGVVDKQNILNQSSNRSSLLGSIVDDNQNNFYKGDEYFYLLEGRRLRAITEDEFYRKTLSG